MRTYAFVVLLACSAARAEDRPATRPAVPRFRPIVICNDFPSAYHAAVADLNRDGRPDVIVLGEPPGGVDWFEQPRDLTAPWPRHTITGDQTQHNIDLAVHDVDGDGRLDLAVASDFLFGDSRHDSLVQWFRPAGGESPWTPARIHAVPTAHRIRWADVDGDGRKELIVVPVLGPGAKPPTYDQATVPITVHGVPRDPAAQPWPAKTIDDAFTVVHGAAEFDWNGDGKADLLTASNQGIHLFITQGDRDHLKWTRRQLTSGHQGEAPNRGSSEVEVGRGPRGRFLAAIEPWHGHEVVVYWPPDGGHDAPGEWRRQVLDDSFRNGHALACTDLDGDGVDEIVAGYRGPGTSLYGYRLMDAPAGRWERFDIDKGGIAAQGCVAADLNGDGRPDLVAVGGSTHNAKLYLNETR